MLIPMPPSPQPPKHHAHLVVFKRAPGPKAAFSLGGKPGPAATALSRFLDQKRIKNFFPLGRRPRDKGPDGGMMALSHLIAREGPPQGQAEEAIIELGEPKDVSELCELLAKDPAVEFAAPVAVRYLMAAGRPPSAASLWNLQRIHWAQARARAGFKEAGDIRVGVIDSGIETGHPDLGGRVSHYDFAHPVLPGASSAKDILGHGTHVSGTIGAVIGNEFGINGICQAPLFVWKVFKDEAEFDGSGYSYFVDPVMYRNALDDCLDKGIRVLNLSLGGAGEPDPAERARFDRLLAAGCSVVAAMGNERMLGSPVSYPAAIPGVVAVGATSLDDRVAQFSNRGGHISLCAPGVAVWSTLPTYPGNHGYAAERAGGQVRPGQAIPRETHYGAWQGTSMAAPHVTAALALLLANKGPLSPARARDRLMETAERPRHMRSPSFDEDYGAGVLDLVRLLS